MCTQGHGADSFRGHATSQQPCMLVTKHVLPCSHKLSKIGAGILDRQPLQQAARHLHVHWQLWPADHDDQVCCQPAHVGVGLPCEHHPPTQGLLQAIAACRLRAHVEDLYLLNPHFPRHTWHPCLLLSRAEGNCVHEVYPRAVMAPLATCRFGTVSAASLFVFQSFGECADELIV